MQRKGIQEEKRRCSGKEYKKRKQGVAACMVAANNRIEGVTARNRRREEKV